MLARARTGRLAMRRRGLRSLRGAVLLPLLLALLLVPVPGAAAEWAPPGTVYIPQTGHQIAGGFLTYWRENGRATYLGNPITEPVMEGGLTVQYFEKVRLELRGNTVSIGALGTETLVARGIDLDGRPRRARLVRGNEFDEPATTPFTRLPFALFPVDPADHRFFPESGHTIAYSMKLAWERTGELERYGYPLSEEFPEVSPIDGKVYTTQYFERARFEYHPGQINNYSIVLAPLGTTIARARGLSTAAVARGADVPDYDEALFARPLVTASRPSGANKWIDVNLSEQYLTAFEGNTIAWRGYISSGRDGHETPVGTFSIFQKLVKDDMRGPDPDEPNGEYFQPDVPWVMYFAGGGYAIHGVYWHSSFGIPRSHGCVGAPVGAANFLYNWAPLGTSIVIHY